VISPVFILFKMMSTDISLFHSQEMFDEVRIALVGKYTDLKDSYMSVTKSLEHSAFRIQRKLTILVRLLFLFLFINLTVASGSNQQPSNPMYSSQARLVITMLGNH
jgi:hypothetical protein